MSDHFNGLTPAELERLAILAEEAAEVVQIAMKIMRHGYNLSHPDYPGQTNRDELEKEIGHVNSICARMVGAGDIRPEPIVEASKRKEAGVDNWTHHQPHSRWCREE